MTDTLTARADQRDAAAPTISDADATDPAAAWTPPTWEAAVTQHSARGYRSPMAYEAEQETATSKT